MKATSRAAGIEPAIGTTAAHLAIHHNAAVPGAVALVAVLTRGGGKVAGDMGKEGFDVAPSREVELLLRSALMGEPQARFSRETLRETAVDIEGSVARVPRHLFCGLDETGVHVVGRRVVARS